MPTHLNHLVAIHKQTVNQVGKTRYNFALVPLLLRDVRTAVVPTATQPCVLFCTDLTIWFDCSRQFPSYHALSSTMATSWPEHVAAAVHVHSWCIHLWHLVNHEAGREGVTCIHLAQDRGQVAGSCEHGNELSD